MKTTTTTFALCLSMFGLGCGAPIEDGAEEDVVASQEEALLSSPGKCEVTYSATLKKTVQSGYCWGGTQCIKALSADCVVGLVAPLSNTGCYGKPVNNNSTCQ